MSFGTELKWVGVDACGELQSNGRRVSLAVSVFEWALPWAAVPIQHTRAPSQASSCLKFKWASVVRSAWPVWGPWWGWGGEGRTSCSKTTSPRATFESYWYHVPYCRGLTRPGAGTVGDTLLAAPQLVLLFRAPLPLLLFQGFSAAVESREPRLSIPLVIHCTAMLMNGGSAASNLPAYQEQVVCSLCSLSLLLSLSLSSSFQVTPEVIPFNFPPY